MATTTTLYAECLPAVQESLEAIVGQGTRFWGESCVSSVTLDIFTERKEILLEKYQQLSYSHIKLYPLPMMQTLVADIFEVPWILHEQFAATQQDGASFEHRTELE